MLKSFLSEWPHFIGFFPPTQTLEPVCTAAQLSSFQFNGHNLRFHPQTQKLEPPCTA